MKELIDNRLEHFAFIEGGYIDVKQVKSGAGKIQSQKRTIKAMKLRMHKVVRVSNNASVRGMIAAVAHLVQIMN